MTCSPLIIYTITKIMSKNEFESFMHQSPGMLLVQCFIKQLNSFIYMACKILYQEEKYVNSKMPKSVILYNAADLQICLIYVKTEL
jgi:hypothetical protein